MQPLDLFYSYCHLQGLAPKTIKGHKAALTTYLRQYPNLFEVNDRQALSFFLHGKSFGFATNRPASPSSYNNFRNSLNKFYLWAIRYGYTTNNPIENVPRCKMPKAIPRRLSDEETMRVLYHAQNYPHPSRYLRARNYALVATLLMTGLRAQELLDLRNEDVRVKELTIRVRHGKGDKERYVYFSEELPPILRDYLSERDRVKKQSIYFFVSYGSNLGLRYRNLGEVLRTISRRSSVHVTAHRLRHTSFSMLLEKDVDLRIIQAQAGHASIVSTQRYVHVSNKRRREKIRSVSFL